MSRPSVPSWCFSTISRFPRRRARGRTRRCGLREAHARRCCRPERAWCTYGPSARIRWKGAASMFAPLAPGECSVSSKRQSAPRRRALGVLPPRSTAKVARFVATPRFAETSGVRRRGSEPRSAFSARASATDDNNRQARVVSARVSGDAICRCSPQLVRRRATTSPRQPSGPETPPRSWRLIQSLPAATPGSLKAQRNRRRGNGDFLAGGPRPDRQARNPVAIGSQAPPISAKEQHTRRKRPAQIAGRALTQRYG